MKVTVIRPASKETDQVLTDKISDLSRTGWSVNLVVSPPDPDWAYTSGTISDRARLLNDALTSDTDVIWCARGGYGASELLPQLEYAKLNHPKLLVGFSDVSALHSALYSRLGWMGLHAVMPATSLWAREGERSDIDQTLAAVESFVSGNRFSSSLEVTPVGNQSRLSGKLFGGCFSVLTNLIGTPFFPTSLKGHILFLEDIDEHPGRLMRHLQQWIQSGYIDQIEGIIVGALTSLGTNIPDNASFVMERFAKLTGKPVFHSPKFGHVCPNYPMMTGATASVEDTTLTWSIEGKE